MSQKDEETQCLNIIIPVLKKSKGLEKQLYYLLTGEEVERTEQERPDFVKCSIANGRKTIIGIEHFRIDHISKPSFKNESVIQAKNRQIEKSTLSFLDSKKDADEITLRSEESLSKLLNLYNQNVQSLMEASYNDYISSFEYVLKKHAKSSEIYKANIERIAREKSAEAKLAFLFEIHMSFSNLYYYDKNTFTLNTSCDQYPIFRRIIDIIESNLPKEVDFIILFFNGIYITDNYKVIALKAEKIQSQLEKRHIPIYDYFGEDYCWDSSIHLQSDVQIESHFSYIDNKIHITKYNSICMPEEERIQYIYNACYHVIQAINAKKAFITTPIVYEILKRPEVILAKWRKNGDLYFPLLHD